MINSQPHKGSNNTNSIPRPNPIIQTAKVFLRSLNIISYLLYDYYINFHKKCDLNYIKLENAILKNK